MSRRLPSRFIPASKGGGCRGPNCPTGSGLLRSKLRRGLTSFLRSEDPVLTPISDVIQQLHGAGASVYLVGGILRYILTGRNSAFPRDVDIIYTGISEPNPDSLKMDTISKNRFGGLKATRGGWSFDLWSIEKTWAFQRYPLLYRSIYDYPRTPFLTLDTCVAEVLPDYRIGQMHESGFFESMINKQLDLNCAWSPFPSVSVVRSLILGERQQFSLSRQLASYIVSYVESHGVAELDKSQLTHYHRHLVSGSVITKWIDEVRICLRDNDLADRIYYGQARLKQLHLWDKKGSNPSNHAA